MKKKNQIVTELTISHPGGEITEELKINCLKLMRKLFDLKKSDSYSMKDYENHFIGFERNDIRTFLKETVSSMHFEKAQYVPLEFDTIYNEMISQLNKMISGTEMYLPADKLKTYLTMSKIMEDKLKVMEKFGIIDKIMANASSEQKDELQEQLKEMNKIFKQVKPEKTKKEVQIEE